MIDLPAVRRWLVATSRGVPLPVLLSSLRLLQRLVPLEHLAVRRAGTEVLGLQGRALLELCRRSWWGTKAGEILAARLDTHPKEVLGLVDPPDFGAVERARAQGRGVVLAAAHVGPLQVAAYVVHQRFPEALFLRHDLHWRGPERPRILPLTQPEDRRRALASALAHLRVGGIVHGAPDGRSMDRSIDVPFGDGVRPMARGLATLARLAGAAALPVGVGWHGARLRVLIGEALAPTPAPSDPVAWEIAWLAAYLACVDRWSRNPPENLPAVGGVYEWLERRAGGATAEAG